LIGKPGGKGPLGRPRHREENNIKMHLGEKGLEGVNWIHIVRIGTGGGLL
jgi:hypothetical protein